MRIPLKWLSDYVDVSSVSVEQLKSGLFSCGLEVEEVIFVNENVNKIVTCKILEKSQHPAADRLFVCKVDAGEYGILQIVTNATNVKVGDIVPVAVDGATLSDGTKIKNGKLRGVESFGMFCGGAEIGITDEYYDGASCDSVLIFHDEFPLGKEVSELLDIKDVVFDVSVTANRPDCQSVLGIAREVAALLNQKIKMPDLTVKGTEIKTEDKVKVTVLDSELCSRYIAGYCYDMEIKPSPKWMQRRLALMGIRAINNAVDITNYVLNEIGQPMLAFDYSELTGREIVVRRANEGETIVTLDEKEFKLGKENLVICDKDKPSCLAGIMGGLGSGIKDDTKEIVFESAKFKRDNVRKTSRSLNQRSDSSARFEKGVDAYTTELGMKRALNLIETLGVGKVAKTIVDVNACSTEKKVITCNVDKINKLLGIVVPNEIILKILNSLEFECELVSGVLTVKVPLYRDDIEGFPDLAEEIIRMYGYDHIVNSLLSDSAITTGGRSKAQNDELSLKRYLASIGFFEVITYSFISPKDYLNFGLDPEKESPIKLKNPLGEDVSLMRTTLLPSIVAATERNKNKKNLSGRIYEFAKVYIPESLPLTDLPEERNTLAISMFGEGENFFTLKGAIEGLFSHLCFSEKLRLVRSDKSFLHPTVSADVFVGDKKVGYLGELHPDVAKKVGIEQKIYVAELDYQYLSEYFTREYCVKVFSKFPSVERDLAILCSLDTAHDEIVSAIESAEIKNLTDIKLFDVYTGDRLPEGKKSLAYRLTFSSMEKTLDDEEIERYVKKILKKLNELGVSLR